MTTSQHSSSSSPEQFSFASDLLAVPDTVQQVISSLPQGITKTPIEIELALTEALNNAVIHGNQSDAEKQVNLAVVTADGRTEVRVVDEACSLSEDALIDAEMPEAVATSGRGLALIRTLLPESRVSSGCLVLVIT